jgi:hypothetical protein
MSPHAPLVDVIVRLALVAAVSAPHTSCTTAPERESASPAEPLVVEGFYPLDALTPDFYAAKRIPLEGPGVPSPIARVGKLVLMNGERTVPSSELARMNAFYCGSASVRAWNESLCASVDAARCIDDQCTYVHFGNCSGFAAGDGRFLTAAHCVAPLLDDEAARSASYILFSSPTGVPSRTAFTVGKLLKLEFARHFVSLDETPVDVAVLRIDDGGLKAHAIARTTRGEVVHMVGFPRAERRSEEARARHGYENVAGTLAVSFGEVDDENGANRPLCSTDGLQEHWALADPCPSADVVIDGEPAYRGVLLTRVFTTTMDSMNGFSGAPVFAHTGALVGINSTILATENPQDLYPKGFRAVVTHAGDALALID